MSLLLLLVVVTVDVVSVSGWSCPSIPSSLFSCSCSLPRTLRCDGSLDRSDTRQALRRIVTALKNLPDERGVSVLDISLQNVTSLPPKLFQGLRLDGLVISTGSNGSMLIMFSLLRQLKNVHLLFQVTFHKSMEKRSSASRKA